MLYIFIFHVLDGSIFYPVWIKRTVVVNYYKANDISWQVILPSCACWFFPWLYCFYKCTNSYWNDETLVCTALIRTLSSVVPSVDYPAHKTVPGLELGTYSSETQVLSFTKVKNGAWGQINSLVYLAMGSLIINITSVARDDLDVSHILKSKHCVRWEKSIREVENNNWENEQQFQPSVNAIKTMLCKMGWISLQTI